MAKRRYAVVVVDEKTDVRQRLVDYYFKKLRCRYARYDRSVVWRARDVLDAYEKVNKGARFDMFLFSLDFPDAEMEQLRDWLSYIHMDPIFIMAPVGRLVQAKLSLV